MKNSKFPNDIKFVIPVCLVLFMVGVSILGMYFGIIVNRQGYSGYDFSRILSSANKVVLFIGDGMGEAHIQTAQSYYQKQMYIKNFEISGEITTYSNSVLTPTDSAAAASALATGKKFDNKEVSRHNGENVSTICEYAKSLGYGVGIVTTDSLDGATPASFSSHANSRGDSDEIIAGQIESNVDLFLGAGKNKYLNFEQDFIENAYTVCSTLSELNSASGKLVGSFEKVVADESSDSKPTLQDLTKFAINYFESYYPNGYFVMIEGAHIDKCSHNKDVFGMVNYLNSFDESIKIVDEKIGNQQGTALIVTADHETGGLEYGNENKSEISNSMYKANGHTGKNVPYFIKLTPQNSITSLSNAFPKVMDNTDIYRICRSCFG